MKKLKILIEKNINKKDRINDNILKLLLEKELYISAYQKLKSKPGNMTPGTDNTTLDEFTLSKILSIKNILIIEEIIKSIKEEKFKFKPNTSN